MPRGRVAKEVKPTPPEVMPAEGRVEVGELSPGDRFTLNDRVFTYDGSGGKGVAKVVLMEFSTIKVTQEGETKEISYGVARTEIPSDTLVLKVVGED